MMAQAGYITRRWNVEAAWLRRLSAGNQIQDYRSKINGREV